MALHPFDEALALEPADGGWRGHTSPKWANMVGPFGGLTAAVLLRAVESHPDRVGEPVALTVNFAAPVADGVFDISARVVRTNRSNQHWLVELTQDGIVKTNATAVFATRRDTWADTEVRAPDVPAPDAVAAPDGPPLVEWISNFDLRYVDGGVPAPDAGPEPSSVTTLWVRDRRDRPLDFPALTALSDIFYPRVFLRRGAVAPAGTVSMTVYFHADGAALDAVGADFVLARGQANRFARGHFDQSAALWSRRGELLVSTHQLVYFKD
ncbi:acyl-CoA thioesterase [Mycolicibacterium duvalii]|uniref:Acyl-CoA thioesterase n=1 Tax=Mycolicibacterium duvalii TaxID=39688 RepID=A0A7I7JZ82_9MYCO|nr:thioesterase family protein [Mycolicibacterium duvalii]MCV7366899.1 thioesterase family protein [Mycolicibacterium duvalii]PEG44010.1 acyl-CoA thioesterase [Mycolicibacterium duvalii]BBX16638.1 acyl-CoA thioesterase [Mycolicibacterium duvalii]